MDFKERGACDAEFVLAIGVVKIGPNLRVISIPLGRNQTCSHKSEVEDEVDL